MVLTRGEQGADCETAGYFASSSILSRTTISSSRPVKVNSYKKRRACNMQTNGLLLREEMTRLPLPSGTLHRHTHSPLEPRPSGAGRYGRTQTARDFAAVRRRHAETFAPQNRAIGCRYQVVFCTER